MDGLWEIIMAKKLRITLPILAAFLLLGLCNAPAFAAKGGNKPQDIVITEVLVRPAYKWEELCLTDGLVVNEIIEINGADFPDLSLGEPDPVVTLGNYDDSLIICGSTPDIILAICPTYVVSDFGIGHYECFDDGDFLLTVYTVSSEANYDLTIGAVGKEGPPGAEGPAGPPGPAADTCDLENRIYAVIPEFVRSEACGGVGPISAPELLNADGPYSGVQGVDDVWVSFAATVGDLLDEQECIDLSELGCEDFYKAVFTDMGIASLLNYQITATADPGAALFFYLSGDCSAPTLYGAIRQALEDYVGTNGEGTYLPYVLSSGGYDFATMLDIWETIGVLNPLVSVGVAGPGGDILGDIYVPDGTLIISAAGKLSEQTSSCSNELDLPLP